MNVLTKRIEQWAIERGLNKADPNKQVIKLGEEFGELCQGIVKDNKEQIVDSLGDMHVVMTILALQLGLDLEDCAIAAYAEIKDRRGKLVNGTFIKQEDLK